jgi:hypothetical protein
MNKSPIFAKTIDTNQTLSYYFIVNLIRQRSLKRRLHIFMYLVLHDIQRLVDSADFKKINTLGLQLHKKQGRGHTEETDNRNATAISKNCYQPELNTCYWMVKKM